MSKLERHTQCRLSHESSMRIQVAWIPEAFAKPKKQLRLKVNEVWEDGWVVEAVYKTLPTSYLVEHERDYKNQRKASDIDSVPTTVSKEMAKVRK